MIRAVVAACLGAALLPAAPARADGPWMCLAAEGRTAGPCQVPEPTRYLPAAGAMPPAVAANFGLLLPGESGSWQFVCDDGYDTAPPERLWRVPGGGFFAGGARGLLRSDDGCEWQPVEGDLGGRAIEDLLVEPGPSGRVWALGAQPGILYLSSDRGQHFTAQPALADSLPAGRLRVAPSDPTRLYATAGSAGMPPRLWASRDAGQSWNAQHPAATLPGPLAVLSVSPDDAEVVYFKVTEPEGDELWKSADGGKTLARVLKLADFELMVGLAFGPSGPSGQTGPALYIAGRAPIVVDGVPPGRLYVSRDGGTSWQPPIHSPATGPSYRCLEFSDGKLYACAGGEATGESFLVGVSEDEGRSWAPLLRLADVRGPRACVRSRCLRTELWLCEGYGVCAAADGGADAGPMDAPPEVREDAPGPPPSPGVCSCALGTRPDRRATRGSWWPMLPLLGALLHRRRHRPRNKSAT